MSLHALHSRESPADRTTLNDRNKATVKSATVKRHVKSECVLCQDDSAMYVPKIHGNVSER